jgi:hypothetical protein
MTVRGHGPEGSGNPFPEPSSKARGAAPLPSAFTPEYLGHRHGPVGAENV